MWVQETTRGVEMQELHYQLVDVFTQQRFGGNQLAVFADAEGIDPALMQTLARELNLSETVFVLPPDDPAHDFRLRIFTPAYELPLAGHPTVGAAFVLQHLGKIASNSSIIFEKGVGPIPVTVESTAAGVIAWMQQPNPQMGSIYTVRATIAAMLSLDESDFVAELPVQAVSAGVSFLYVPVKSLEAMGRINVRLDLWEKHLQNWEAPHIFAFSTETEAEDATVHSRMFAPDMGISEDPATGAASGPLGTYLVEHGIVPIHEAEQIISEQGIEMGRPSRIQIRVTAHEGAINAVFVGGYSQFIGSGHILV